MKMRVWQQLIQPPNVLAAAEWLKIYYGHLPVLGATRSSVWASFMFKRPELESSNLLMNGKCKGRLKLR